MIHRQGRPPRRASLCPKPLQKKSGICFRKCRSIKRPRSVGVQALVAQSSQCPTLVSIFEMVPPVQRVLQHLHHTTLPMSRKAVFRAATYRSIPWTGGNPKQNHNFPIFRVDRSIPWTGGNPKQAKGSQ